MCSVRVCSVCVCSVVRVQGWVQRSALEEDAEVELGAAGDAQDGVEGGAVQAARLAVVRFRSAAASIEYILLARVAMGWVYPTGELSTPSTLVARVAMGWVVAIAMGVGYSRRLGHSHGEV